MDKLSKEQQYVIRASLGLGVLVILTWVGLWVFGRGFAQAIVAGEGPVAYLHGNAMRLLGSVPTEEQASVLYGLMKTYLGRLTTVYLFCQCLLSLGSLRYPNLFANFFGAESHPLNLAIFRILFFINLLPRPSLKRTLHLLQLPDDSRVAPPGLSWMVENLPESPELNTWAFRLFVAACVLGTIGLWTRFACVTATVLTFYFMGITQFFGKIEHQHYLVWVGALLAVSRCADVLSVDALIRKNRQNWMAHPRSRLYGLPLRFVWLFLGVVYFFPGLWKFVISGPNWFISDNLQSRMLLRMFVGEGWSPPFRMDHYPLLCQFSGLTTILWEIGFIFLIFLPLGRYLAAFVGLSFHWMVKLFLGISFWPIQILYVTFFDWQRILSYISQRLGWGTSATNIDDQDRGSAPTPATPRGSLRGVWIVGTIVVVGNLFCGFTMLDSWPFGVYPTFARIIDPSFDSLSLVLIDENGEEFREIEAFFDPTVRENFGVDIGRLGEILGVATRPHADRAERLTAIWEEWHEDHPEVSNVSQVHFYRVRYSTNPDDPRTAIRQKLLETIQVGD